ncbi:MAG TPA: YegS/Rv2252/BmrU family lipid kinase [Gemmatimonadaceae bacterium]|nr:YegS/Rv2252/BmrU family lipid kinase [Gemmatimonadaceae bacterium]
MSAHGDRARTTISLVIHGSRADDDRLRALVDDVRNAGIRVRPRVTFELGDAATFAREEALRGDVRAVVAVGGDGTVNEVVNGLAGTGVPLGIIPLGTANDFATQVGIPEEPHHAMDLILHQAPVRLDTAELNGRRFLNVSSGGIGAEATFETGAMAKAALGPLAYALTGLRKLVALEATTLHVAMPGQELDVDALLFFVGNARTSGGGMPVTPLAAANDGLLDVCVIERAGRAELARLAVKVARGEHVGEPGVLYWRVPWVTIHGIGDHAGEPLPVNVDGERAPAAELRYRVWPGDLLAFLPPHGPPRPDPAALESLAAQLSDDAAGQTTPVPPPDGIVRG